MSPHLSHTGGSLPVNKKLCAPNVCPILSLQDNRWFDVILIVEVQVQTAVLLDVACYEFQHPTSIARAVLYFYE